jgi:hypothetical protein
MAIERAVIFLRELLAGGPLLSNNVRERAEAAGFAWSTIRRAKDQLGVLAVRESEGGTGAGRWLWSLPKGQATIARTMQAAQAVQMEMQAAQPSSPPRAAPTPAAQLPAAQPPPRLRTITVRRPGIAPEGPDSPSGDQALPPKARTKSHMSAGWSSVVLSNA